MKRLLCVLAVLSLLAVPVFAEDAGGMEEVTIGNVAFQEGWEVKDNHRVFYEIFVGSFSDSDGDGLGDLRGIINRLDYLNDGDAKSGKSLGIEGIWLSPINESPSYHKYDVADYMAIDDEFGTMDDLKELVQKCHDRGIKVIMDFVINHSSKENTWFKEFIRITQLNFYGGFSVYNCIVLL